MRLTWKSFIVAYLMSYPAFAAGSVLPANRFTVNSVYHLEIAPDCERILLTEAQYRVLNEALTQHREKTHDPTHESFSFIKKFQLLINGTANQIAISQEEKDILDALRAAKEPLTEFANHNADEVIRSLNIRAWAQFKTL